MTYSSESSWQAAWDDAQGRSSVASFGRSREPGTFEEAAQLLSREMLLHGFRLFRNGGVPLLERRAESLVQEIVIQPGPRSVKGEYSPLTLKVHVTHEGLREVRERYWPTGTRVPKMVASGQLGLVDDPPKWVIWDVASGGDCLDELVQWTANLAPAWFDHFDTLDSLREEVLTTAIPLITQADVLELVLAENGRGEAKRFLRDILATGVKLAPASSALIRADENSSLEERLDAISKCYRLR